MKDTSAFTISAFFHRSSYLLPEDGKRASNCSIISAGILVYVCVLIWRSWNNFSHPGFHVEDSIHYFNIYYGNTISFISAMQQHPHGYLNIYNNIMAFLIAKADILLQPLLYQLVSTILAVITVSAFCFSGLLKNRALLFVAPILLGLSGMNHLLYYISLTFQMYVVVVLLLVLLLYRRFSSVPAEFFLFLLMSFLIWSGPYSVLVVPFSMVFMVLFKGRTRLFCGLIVVALFYTSSVQQSTIMLGNLFKPEILAMWGKILVTDVFFMGFKTSVNLEKILLIVLLLGAVYYTLRKDVFFIKASLLFWTLIIASFAPFFLSQKYLIYKVTFPCHLLIAQFFWLALVLFMADRILMRIPSNSTPIGVGLALLALVFTVSDGARNPRRWQIPIFPSMPAFLQEVKKFEGMGLKERNEQVIVTTPGTVGVPVKAVVGKRGKHVKKVTKLHIP